MSSSSDAVAETKGSCDKSKEILSKQRERLETTELSPVAENPSSSIGEEDGTNETNGKGSNVEEEEEPKTRYKAVEKLAAIDHAHAAGKRVQVWAREKSLGSCGKESLSNGESLEFDDMELEEPFSDSEEDEDSAAVRAKRSSRPMLQLPMPRRRIRTLSGTVPPVGYSPVWGGPTMCLGCLEFFDLPNQTNLYVEHLLDKHKTVITDIELIVDLRRYVEYWRHRFGNQKIEDIFEKVVPKESDRLHGKVEWYYLMSEALPEDAKIRERLALRRLEEVLSCQQREREDITFSQACLFCRYRARGNRSKMIHHLYMIHHLNLGSPENLVFFNEYMDLLKHKLDNSQCLYCEKVFQDHQVLMEHMRKRQHREVNPKNSYYDRFYVINYLELGKKWLEVLAEDFEDNTPTFVDSDDEEEDETWHEWQEDNTDEDVMVVVCLFCDSAFPTAQELLDHLKEGHQFNLEELFEKEKLTFYDRIKVLNFIRKLSYVCVCFVCGRDDLKSWEALRKHLAENNHLCGGLPARERWDKEEYLMPVFENDHLLWMLESTLSMKEEEGALSGSGGDSVDDAKLTSSAKETEREKELAEVVPEDLPELDSILKDDKELLEQLK